MQFIEYLRVIDDNDFYHIYINYFRRNKYKFLTNGYNISEESSELIIKNMFMLDGDDKSASIIYDLQVIEYSSKLYSIFKQIILSTSVKVVTNCGFNNIDNIDNITIDPYFDTKYVKKYVDLTQYNTTKFIFNIKNLIQYDILSKIDDYVNDKIAMNNIIPENKNYSIEKYNYK